MPKINILPKHIADLIAAGEVVERPASVVKELMENSIDAGATSITVEIRRGGITYIRITDNGCGISREDIKNAFKSHATSKIQSEEDLLEIGTLGFRGEALASVAAVSRVDILTCTPEENIGTLYKIEGSEEILLDDAGCPKGTTIVVKDLFFNTPARMKFLKKDVTEGNAVAGVVDRIALSHPEVSVRFIRDDKQQLVTSGNGKLNSTVYSVFGKDFENGLVDTDYELDGISVSGLVSLPAASRANRSMQFFFLNGRLVKSVTAQTALEQAYKNSIMVGRFPACVLNITAPLETVDVNVHPAKTEVRFENEKRIFDAVYYAAKSAIDEKDKPSRIDLSRMELKNKSPFIPDEGEQIRITQQGHKVSKAVPVKNPDFWSTELPKEYKKVTKEAPVLKDKPKSAGQSNIKEMPKEQELPKQQTLPEKQEQSVKEDKPPVPYVRNSEKVSQSAVKPIEITETQPEVEPPKVYESQEEIKPIGEADSPSFRMIGEAFATYILVESEGKIILIDKHAAHERMLFEKLKAEAEDVKSQVLLTPLTVMLSKEEYEAVISSYDILKSAGWEIGDFGAGCVVVRECPVMLIDEDIKSLVEEMAGYLLESHDPTPEKLNWLYHNMACRAAIKGGDKTTEYELYDFTKKVLSSPAIRYCPHGRPVLIEMSRSELEKQFGRII